MVANTMFPHEKFRLATWHAPNEKDHLQLDFIMVTQKLRTSLLQGSTRLYPGAHFGSDHELLMAWFRTRLRETKKAEITRLKHDTEKLPDPAIAMQYRATIRGKFGALLLIEDVQEQAEEVTKRMNETTTEILGTRRRPRKPWITEEVLEMCDNKGIGREEDITMKKDLKITKQRTKRSKKVSKGPMKCGSKNSALKNRGI